MATKKFVSKDNLSRVWTRLFGKVLNSKEEIEANTSENMIAGATSVKELYSSLTADNAQQFQFAYDSESGKYGYKAKVEGADTFFPFKNCELKKATVPAFTGVTKSVSTDGKAHVIMLAICGGDGNTTYNLFAIYSDGEYGDSFTINRGSEPGKTGTFIQNVTDSGFTINLGVSNIVNSAICYYIT